MCPTASKKAARDAKAVELRQKWQSAFHGTTIPVIFRSTQQF